AGGRLTAFCHASSVCSRRSKSSISSSVCARSCQSGESLGVIARIRRLSSMIAGWLAASLAASSCARNCETSWSAPNPWAAGEAVPIDMERTASAPPTVIVQTEPSGWGPVYLKSAMYLRSDDCSAESALKGPASISSHRVRGSLVFRIARTISLGGSPLLVSGWSEKYVSHTDTPLVTSTSTLSLSDRNLYL